MAISARAVGFSRVEYRGMSLKLATPATWYRAVRLAGFWLQSKIDASFEAEKLMGSSWLLPNDPKYTKRKIKQGHDKRRGHRTLELQLSLGQQRPLFEVFRLPATKDKDKIGYVVKFSELWLRSRVPHAEFYAKQKTRLKVKRILVLAESWVVDSKQFMDVVEIAAFRKMTMMAGAAVPKFVKRRPRAR